MQALILAAGKGTRFSDEKSKVLHEVNGISLVKHVINLVDSVGIQKKVVVIGHQGEAVQKHLQDSPNILFAWQHEQKGTGHAVMMAETFLSFDQDVLILYGDVPALKEETIRKLLNEHQTSKNQVTILSANLDNPKWYGRIVREDGEIVAIREMRDASDEELREQMAELVKIQLSAQGLEVTEEIYEQAINEGLETITLPWTQFFLFHDPAPVLAKIKCPVLAMNATKDVQVDSVQNLTVIEEVKENFDRDITIVELEGLNHLFQLATTGSVAEYGQIETTFDTEALEIMTEWIDEVTDVD